MGKATITEWVRDGYLFLVYPRVYGVGHRAPSVEAELWAAVLYAGPGAALSHRSAAWWWQLTNRRPRAVEVSTPRRCKDLPGITLHRQRTVERIPFNGIPVTSLAQTLIDVAVTEQLDDLRYMLAEADYHRRFDLALLEPLMGQGRRGTRKLRRAINTHNRDLARTQSRSERAFLNLCERAGLPPPLVNAKLCGFTVDFYWPEYRLVVEIDGELGHGTDRQVARDHGRDLKLRSVGIATRRYAEPQVLDQGEMVSADVLSAIELAA